MEDELMPISFSSLSGADGTLQSFAVTLENGRSVIEETFAPGVYTFTAPSGVYSIAFYNASDTLVGGFSSSATFTEISVTTSEEASKLLVTSTILTAPITASYTASGSKIPFSITEITATQSVTITEPTLAIVFGGGGGGRWTVDKGGGGGGSGYLASGVLSPGTYTATIGVGGGNSADGSASTIGSITANGGKTGTIARAGGDGGSGGGGGQDGSGGLNYGALGGSAGSDGGVGYTANPVTCPPGTGSGVPIQGLIAGAGGDGRGAYATGGGGRLYSGGGGAGGSASGAGQNALYATGGGGGGSSAGGAGGDGLILLIEGWQ
jgi:hypothetical protein